MPTNLDLARSGSFASTLSFIVCTECNHASNAHELSRPEHPCPHCGARAVREVMPDTSGASLLRMIAYFYVVASERQSESHAKLVKRLYEETGKQYPIARVLGVWKEINALYRKPTAARLPDEQVLDTVRERLSLESNEQASKAWTVILANSAAIDEHKVIVLLVCSLLENLFQSLLVGILVAKGKPYSEAESLVDRWRTFDRRCESFELLTGQTLKSAIAGSSLPRFYDEWNQLRTKRNNFVHKTPYAISPLDAEKAFNLTKSSISIFAFLQNGFSRKPKQTEP